MTRIGFIGLGIMGRPMARNLLRAGHRLVVHSRSPGPVESLVAAGAEAAPNPREVALRADVVITMLPDAPDVEAVLLGPGGVAEGVRPGMLVIDMSTSSPALARRLAAVLGEKGADVLDAPVSGGEKGAEEGTLSIMVGGSAAAFERALPVLRVLGKNIVHVGEAGAGQVAKAANQIVVGLTLEAVAEALLLATRAGVDPARVREALLGGFAYSRILEVHGKRMLERDFQPGFKAWLHRKDLGIALGAGREYGVPLPGTALVHELLTALVAGGGREVDHSALVTVLERLAPGRPEEPS